MNITIPDTVTYACKKTGKSYDAPVSTYTQAVNEHIYTVGMARILGDTHANDKTAAEAEASIMKKLDAWARGDLRNTRETGPETPERRAMKLALARLQKEDRFKSGQLKIAGRMDELKAEADKLAKSDKFLAAAKAQLDLEATLADIEA